MATKKKSAKPTELLDAEALIKAAIKQSDQVITLEDDTGAAALAELGSVLQQADRKLATKLAYLAKAGKGRTFTAAQAAGYQAQIKSTIVSVQEKVSGIAVRTGESAMRKSVGTQSRLIAGLHKVYDGATMATPLVAAMQKSPAQHGNRAMLLTRVATSMDRYGEVMGKEFAKIIQVGLASGATVDQMVASLVRHGGPKGVVSLAARETAPGVVQRIREGKFPDGLFKAKKYWAERIVRTETAHAYNAASFSSLQGLKAAGEDVRKKIVAVFDNRTAPDSVAVHGQIRELDQPFMDGAGRVYQYPPARPNDREVVIGWYDDWAETPSSEPPSPAEHADALELAQQKPVPWSGFTPGDVAQLKAQGELADKVQAERELAEQTRAHQQITELQLAKSARVAGVRARAAKAAQDAERLAKAAAKKQLEAQDKKIAKAFKASKKAPATPHEGQLALWEMAGKNPQAFVDYYLSKMGTGIPADGYLSALKTTAWHPLTESMVKDLTAKHGYPATSLQDHLLVKPEWVSAIAGEKGAKAAKTKAALLHSKGTAWKLAESSAKKNGTLWKVFQEAHGVQPAPAAPAPPKYELKSGGTGYVDVHDPDSGKKLAYFQQVGSSFVVKPPSKLSGWAEQSFPTQEDAALYAIKVGEAIQKLPPANPSFPSATGPKTSPYNHQPGVEPKTRIAPLKLDQEAAAEQRGIRRKAAEHFNRHGVKTRAEGVTERNAVDQVLEQADLASVQDAWSGRHGGCWYGSSTGAKAYAGKLVAKDKVDGRDEHDMAKQIGHADPDKMATYARTKYGATQEALERRLKAGDKIAQHVDADGYVELYRGLSGKQGEQLRAAREQGEVTRVALRSVSSWSTKRSAATGFASGPEGVVVRARVHVSRIFSQYEQEEIAMRRFGDSESEWIVIADDEYLDVHSHDLQNPYDE
jgi:hypothetical protein